MPYRISVASTCYRYMKFAALNLGLPSNYARSKLK